MKAIFRYPKEFVTLPGYTAHADQEVEVGKVLQEGNDDEETMLEITAKDGWKGEAFESELEYIDHQPTNHEEGAR